MTPILRPPTRIPRELAGPVRQGQASRIWRLIGGAALVVATSVLVTDLVIRPSKRSVEILCGVGFLGLAIIASPLRVLAFAITLLPYPMETSVGSSSTLMILAISALIMTKRRQYSLASPFFYKPTDLAIMGLALMMVLSLNQLAPTEYALAGKSLCAFAAAVCLYYGVIQVVDNVRTFHVILRVFMVTATSVGLVSTLQTLFPGRPWLPSFFQFSAQLAEYAGDIGQRARVYASFAGISPFGEFVAASLIFHYVLFRRAKSLAERMYWIVSALLLAIGMLGSATRMSVLVLGVGVLYMTFLGARVIPRAQLLTVLFILFSVFLLALPFVAPVTEQMTARLEMLGPQDSSTQSRRGVMEEAFHAIPDSPLVGHGIVVPLGTFRGPVTRVIHCLYLHLPYTIGIPGLIAFIWYMVILFRLSARAMNDRSLPVDLREFLLAMNTTLVMFAVYELTSDYITDPMSTHFVWLRFGLLMALVRIAGRIQRGRTSVAR
jgi:hypothetical protein